MPRFASIPVFAATLALGLSLGFVVPASAEIVTRPAAQDVAMTMDALVAAVEGAGATVFARVDHGAGAAGVEMELGAAELLIFGNPQLGTPAMQDAMLAGLYLPLRVLVHDSAGGTVIAYEDPGAMLTALDGIEADAAYLERMRSALERLTSAAAATE